MKISGSVKRKGISNVGAASFLAASNVVSPVLELHVSQTALPLWTRTKVKLTKVRPTQIWSVSLGSSLGARQDPPQTWPGQGGVSLQRCCSKTHHSAHQDFQSIILATCTVIEYRKEVERCEMAHSGVSLGPFIHLLHVLHHLQSRHISGVFNTLTHHTRQ